jgi:hypothetical protein
MVVERMHSKGPSCVVVLAGLLTCYPANGQEAPVPTKLVAPCLEPPPMIRWGDYQGPFPKTVAALTGRLERRSVPSPHYKPGTVLCSLELQDKFILFAQDAVDPLSFLSAGFNAGLDQAGNKYPSFGQGSAGYGKRFGANFLNQTSHSFFTEFAYPAIFKEDPRYYRLAHGSVKSRLLHAAGHAFVAHRDNGKAMFNVSEWLGTSSAVWLSNTYYAGGARGFAPEARQIGYAVLQDVGWDVLREFWPEIAHKLKMPFRDRREPAKNLPPE